MPVPLLIFYSYADQDSFWQDELEKHLALMKRTGQIIDWQKRDIEAGREWRKEVDERLNAAQIILLLISPDFLASDYCYCDEMKHAMERHASGEAHVIPILIRPVTIAGASFHHLSMLPSNAVPVALWPDKDEAFLDIAQGIGVVVAQFFARSQDYWLALGQAHNRAGRYELALAAFEYALERDPTSARAYRGKGDALYNAGRYQEALAAYESALHIDPTHARTARCIGDIYFKTGNYQEALAAYRQAIRLDPKNAEGYRGKGNTCYSMKRYKEALAAYEKAITCDPRVAVSFHNYGCTLAHLRRYDQSVRAFSQALALKPDFKQAYLSRADALEQLGRVAEAQADRAAAQTIGVQH